MKSHARLKKLKGFTLMEMIVALGVFAIMSVSITMAFSSGFSSFKNARELQRNLESAQFAMNTLAKQLRTSTVVNGSGTVTNMRFYDYSSGRCFQYQINGNRLQARWVSVAIPSGQTAATVCTAGAIGAASFSDLTSGYVSGSFSVLQSSATIPRRMGLVAVSLMIQNSVSSSLRAQVQTTVSLRDYKYVGF